MASSARDIVRAYPQAGQALSEKIVEVAGRLGIPDPGWLANLINFESAGTFSFGRTKLKQRSYGTDSVHTSYRRRDGHNDYGACSPQRSGSNGVGRAVPQHVEIQRVFKPYGPLHGRVLSRSNGQP